MGRLRYGETLISQRLEKGESVFPPLPPKKILQPRTIRRQAPTCNSTARNVTSPVKKKQKRGSSPSESLSENENDTVLVDVDESDLLSRLRHFPKMKSKNKSSLRLHRGHASRAEFIRNMLISDLMSEDVDVESMVDKANKAFASLSLLDNDFADLYDMVKAFIAHHCQLSEAKKELESLKEMTARGSNLLAQSNVKAKALSSCQANLNEARKNAGVLINQIEQTRSLLKELEEKLAQEDLEIDALKEEHDKLEKTCEATKAEHENIAKQIKERQKMVKQINGRCVKARAGIKRTKALLSSLS